MALTDQKFYEETVQYLRDQKQRSFDEVKQACLYFFGDNCCAIGKGIPEKYKKTVVAKYNFSDLELLISEMPELVGKAIPDTACGYDLAEDLQNLHDGLINRKDNEDGTVGGLSEYGEQRAAKIAEAHGLNYIPPKEK